MAPPPAQKGKFKPRKPAKKIRPGDSATDARDTTSSADATAAVTGPTVAFAPSTDNTTSQAARESGGGREGSGGRGGRGGRGRGRGRAPIPSGRVVFTGSEKPSDSATRRSSAGSSAVGRAKNNDHETTEEVVGQLEIAIGTSKEKTGAKSSRRNSEATAMDYDDSGQFTSADASAKGNFILDGYVYDSDSSNEDGQDATRGQHSRIPPLELPFPPPPVPLGIGLKERPVAYASAGPSTGVHPGASGAGTMTQEVSEPEISPFVDARDADHLSWEQNSWFLVQLPTRLPPLQPHTSDGPMPAYSTDEPMDQANNSNDPDQPPSISEVVTPPLAAKSHDNVLTRTAAGRIGKIIVYKSGKTVLKMEGPNGCSPILMNVNEGLSCSFLQQAVVIDPEESKFVALGTVGKSIVITPNLASAFAD